MVRKLSILALLVCLLAGLLSPGLVLAQGDIAVSASSAKVEFPLKLNFSISAQSASSITDIRLRYKVDQASFADVTSEILLEFNPATRVEARWTWDMRKSGGMPPGTVVTYWWTVKNARGSRVETRPVSLSFDDTRYTWRQITEGKVTILWYEGADTFARELMRVAQATLVQLARDTGARLEKPVEIYIYASSRDLQGAMIFPQEWTGGVTFTRFGTISIGISPSQLAWGSRAMAHELTHLVTNQVTFNAYGDTPVWLDEGLAMNFEGPIEVPFANALAKAIAEQKLFSVRSLASPFSAFADEAILGYAESHSIVAFLIKEYGQAKMLDLLNAFRQGASYDGALMKVYGFDMDGLNALWRQRIMPGVKVG